MILMEITPPTQCHLWTQDPLDREELSRVLLIVREFEDDSHLSRRLLRCQDCGQLYFYEWYEEIDWSEGNDPQYSTWIPVVSAEQAEELNGQSPLGLLGLLSIRADYPSSTNTPGIPRWFGRKLP